MKRAMSVVAAIIIVLVLATITLALLGALLGGALWLLDLAWSWLQ